MLTKAILVSIVIIVFLSVALILLAWLGYTPGRDVPLETTLLSPNPLDCVPDRLVTNEGLTASHCFSLDESTCRVSEGCALVPRGMEL